MTTYNPDQTYWDSSWQIASHSASLKHEGALYKGISFASSGSLETGTRHFYASRSNRELISLRDRTRNYK